MNNLKKKSFSLAGHKTSIALEAEFWEVLGIIAQKQNINLPSLITLIDNERGQRPLASALRVYALKNSIYSRE